MSLMKKEILILLVVCNILQFVPCLAMRPPFIYVQTSNDSSKNSRLEPKFVNPLSWGAVARLNNSPKLKNPVPYVIFYQTNTEECYNRTHCSEIVSRIHKTRMKLMNDNLQYNFLVGGDGLVYVARDWDTTSGVTNGYNGRSIGIGLIGNYFSKVVPDALIRNAIKLIEFGTKNGKINEDAHYISIPPMAFIVEYVDEVMQKFMDKFDYSYS
ncbi:GSCOCT00014020001.2-RA-CDS [Cotesia congregata]|uniref:PGRP.4_Cc n=1 Tax=Cotesia congregata TaxID=51543 RepID=A0A8J2MD16_COTCN|nr:GSCOCT00014020001.2-RA-CDS [Cotesia congregata]CAG5082210.1 PGRP.4_Cc [Cotesia congregata]